MQISDPIVTDAVAAIEAGDIAALDGLLADCAVRLGRARWIR